MRKLHLVFSFVAMIMLVACGGDSNSTKGADPIEEISAESLDDLPNCTKKRESVRAVTEEGSFVCADGVWEAEKKEIPSYETEDELPKCTLKKEGMVIYVEDIDDTLICDSGEWEKANDANEIIDDVAADDVADDSMDSSSSGTDKDADADASESSSSEQSIEEKSSSSSKTSDEGLCKNVEFDAATQICDGRDGQVYNIVVIENEANSYSKVWMAENLRYAGENSYCFRENTTYCSENGRLYTWLDAVKKSGEGCTSRNNCSLPAGNVQGVCPDGWHIPSNNEWSALFGAVGGSSVAGIALKSQTGWTTGGNGTDEFGFCAKPAGNRDYGGGYDATVDDDVNFWSSTKSDAGVIYHICLKASSSGASLVNDGEDYAFSVRCVKN